MNFMHQPHAMYRLAGTVSVGPKGQVVIPAEVRECMNIRPGDKLIALYITAKNAIAFITEDQAQKLVEHLGAQATGLSKLIDTDKN